MKIIFFTIFSLLTLQLYNCNKPITIDDTTVHIMGKSGKMSVINIHKNITSEVDFALNSLQEVDKDGKAVGTSGSVKHGFNSFANLDFTVNDPVNNTIQELDIVEVDFDATVSKLSEDTKIMVNVYLFKKEGNFTMDGESNTENIIVHPGDFKFAVSIKNWLWCDIETENCKNGQVFEQGEFIDFTIKYSQKNRTQLTTLTSLFENSENTQEFLSLRNLKETNETSIDLSDAKLLLSNYVLVDGKQQKMPEGYPKTDIQEKGDSTITFRFPKFVSEVSYDPIIAYESESSSSIAKLAYGLITLVCLLLF